MKNVLFMGDLGPCFSFYLASPFSFIVHATQIATRTFRMAFVF